MPRDFSDTLRLWLASQQYDPALRASLLTFTLSDGVTTYNWTSYDSDLLIFGTTFSSKTPWANRGKWNLTNTMSVPSMDIDLIADNSAFAGGPSIKTQAHNGLFDGATCVLQEAFMSAPGVLVDQVNPPPVIFSGVTAGLDIVGTKITLTVKGKNNILDQYVPRNVYQLGCNHAFCDAGCTLSRVTFTASFTSGGVPTRTFIPWAAAPGSPAKYISGTLAMTSGAADGSRRTIANAGSSGLTLIYPLLTAPTAGDTFTAFQGCDKTLNQAGSVQSCAAYSNTPNFLGFPFVPPPTSGV